MSSRASVRLDASIRSTATLAMLFRPTFIAAAAAGRHRAIVAEVVSATGMPAPSDEDTVSAFLERAYRCMSHRPPEYVVKNEITNQLFLRRHDPTVAAVVSEFRIGASRVDLLVLNGTSCGYEIKTDFDRLDRLAGQVEAYLKVLGRVVVVASASHLADVRRIADPRAGIVVIGPANRLAEIREPRDNAADVEPAAIFDCLRQSEYVAAIDARFGRRPRLPNTEVYGAYREMFARLTPRSAHEILVRALTERLRLRRGEGALGGLPYSLKQVYFDASERDRRELFAGDVLGRSVCIRKR